MYLKLPMPNALDPTNGKSITIAFRNKFDLE